MRRVVLLFIVLAFVPPWMGEPKLPLYRPGLTVTARHYAPPGGWPRRIGRLEPVGGLTLEASDPAFGGFSALALWRGQAILLNDGGNVVRLRIAGRHLQTVAAHGLVEGPSTGWDKESRDAESLALDPATGTAWVGYERVNAIWRYTADLRRVTAWQAPAAMRGWGSNSGPEAMVRLRDGRFLVLREGWLKQRGPREALLFAGDPPLPATRVAALSYEPPGDYASSDAAELPNGDVLVLNRRWRAPLTFSTLLVLVRREDIVPGATLRGRIVADFGATLGHENAEGLAVTRERGRTILWIVTDNDGSGWRPTILAKFRWQG